MKIFSDIPSGIIKSDTRSLHVEGPTYFLVNNDQSITFWTHGRFYKDEDKSAVHEMRASCTLGSGELYALSRSLTIHPNARRAFELLLGIAEGKEPL